MRCIYSKGTNLLLIRRNRDEEIYNTYYYNADYI